jgi:hypothetical protein
MEDQIRKSLLSLRKIAAIDESCKIDTSNNDIDRHLDTKWHNMVRALKGIVIDHRAEIIKVMQMKFKDAKDHANYIMEGKHKKFAEYLPLIAKQLENSRTGLRNFQRNENYKDDNKVRIPVEHFLDDEVPAIIKTINKFMQDNPDLFCKSIDADLIDQELP